MVFLIGKKKGHDGSRGLLCFQASARFLFCHSERSQTRKARRERRGTCCFNGGLQTSPPSKFTILFWAHSTQIRDKIELSAPGYHRRPHRRVGHRRHHRDVRLAHALAHRHQADRRVLHDHRRDPVHDRYSADAGDSRLRG